MHVCLLARRLAVGPVATALRRAVGLVAVGAAASALPWRADAAVSAASSPSDAAGVAPSWALCLTSLCPGRVAAFTRELQANVASLPCARSAEMVACKRL